ncbi:MAG: hypothetical protein ABIQ05_04795 [Candidatus Limnocylindria bacterium]
MVSVFDRPENAGALRHLGRGRDADDAGFGPPPSSVDRWHLGAHPDVVERLWETLNGSLPADARWLVFDGPALVHPASGTILAVGLGTSYGLRLRPEDLAEAVAAGAELVHTFRSVGVTLDLPDSYGPDWAFGSWSDREADWVLASYHAAD